MTDSVSSPDWKKKMEEALQNALRERDTAIRVLQQAQAALKHYQHSHWVPPGHFYSPLLDMAAIHQAADHAPHDDERLWEHVPLHPETQRRYYRDLLEKYPLPPFPQEATEAFRYHLENIWFRRGDAFALSGIIRKEKPARIVEVGSGFSSAVMLDTLDLFGLEAKLTFIEPYPERLEKLLRPQDTARVELLTRPVQEVPLELFKTLQAGDILFIDSSHVAKIGSDVTFLFLRVLPALGKGVLVHFHDIFYPESYPLSWLREGRAWNESMFLRSFLVGNPHFEVVAFNSYAMHALADLFQETMPAFLPDAGGSIWLRTV